MAYIKLLRLPLLLLIAASQLIVHYLFTTNIVRLDYDLPLLQLVLIIATTASIAAGGFVINDYYDMRIDEINHPLKRIVGNEIEKHQVMNLYIGLFIISIVLSLALGFVSGNFSNSFILATVIGLLWFYSSSYKRTLVIGNLIISLAVALIPFFLAIYESKYIMPWYAEKLTMNGIVVTFEKLNEATPTITANYIIVGYVSLFVFATTFVHEIVRSLYEEKGEREMECHSFPIVYGQNTAKLICYAMLALINIVCFVSIINNFEVLRLNTVSYYLCTVMALSGALVMFLKSAENPKDYNICLTIAKLLIFSGVAYGIIYALNNPNDYIG